MVNRSISRFDLLVAGLMGALSMVAVTEKAEAANWLAVQGTENPGTVGRAKVWGFIQPEMQYLKGTTVPVGGFAGAPMNPNTIGPDRNSRATFSLRRARIGVRGQGFPLDNKVNYFFLAEFGRNGITVPGDGQGSVKLTDASVTLNHIPFARLRIGQFKTPGAEEGLQAIHVFDYVNFTNGTDQLLLERFANGDGSVEVTDEAKVNKAIAGVSAFRDIGVQLFDIIKTNGLEISYAGMVGNGNGINRADNNGAKELYGYISVEQVYGGKGARRHGLKAFAWTQRGKRTLITAADGAGNYDRNRSGLGFTFRKGRWSAAAEYISASGLIRNGTDGAAKVGSEGKNKAGDKIYADLNYALDEKANSYYGHLGYKVFDKLELDLRYDVLNRATVKDEAAGEDDERKWTTTTVGAQYFFNKKTRFVFNYEFRSLEAPNLASTAGPNKIGAALDDRISMQLLAIF